MSRRRQRNSLIEWIVVLAAVVLLTAAARPMLFSYLDWQAVSSVRGDLKIFYSQVEGYFTENQEIPENPESVITEWQRRFSKEYTYKKTGPHEYRFVTKEKILLYYLAIDQDGTITQLD
ncbi:MAG: hypothetical protein HGA27_06740 [Peptococcaceae bacterium]|nr:hypothetical protein [Peptococcaceae bacterium]